MTPCTNPWNAVYKLALNKTKRRQTMTTLQKPDGSLTSDPNETVKIVIDHLIPKDEQMMTQTSIEKLGPYRTNPF